MDSLDGRNPDYAATSMSLHGQTMPGVGQCSHCCGRSPLAGDAFVFRLRERQSKSIAR
jgi:hypothetical protein